MGLPISRLWGYFTGFIVIGIIIYLILLYITAQSISAEITGVDRIGFNPVTNNVKICFMVLVNNSGLIDVVIERIYYRIYVENEYLGEGSREDIVIGKGANTIDLCLITESKAVVRTLKNMLVHKGRVNVTIEGYVEIPIKSFGLIKLWNIQLPYREVRKVNIYVMSSK